MENTLVMPVRMLIKLLRLSVLLVLLSYNLASAGEISLQMKVRDPSGTLIDAASVNVRVLVLSESASGVKCVLRDEVFASTSISKGYLGLALGSGTRGNLDPNKEFSSIFSNDSPISGLSCLDNNGSVSGTVSSYSPASSDSRIFRVTIGYAGEDIVVEFKNKVTPYAVVADRAKSADKLSGKSVSDFVQIPSGQPNYQSRVNDLVSDSGNAIMSQILGGTYALPSTRVTGLGALATMTVTGTPSASTYLRGDGTWAAVSGSGGGTVTDVSGTAPISVATGTSTPVISISDATTSAKGAVQVGSGLSVASGVVSLPDTGTAGTYGSNYQVPVITTDAKGRVTGVTVSSITINGSAITAGTIDEARIPSLDAAKIGAGTIAKARLPSDIVYNGGTSAVGFGAAAVSSALLSVTSTSSGFLMPRMTASQRDGITSPATGLQVYNTDSNQINYYNGSSWQALGVAGAGISSLIAGTGLTGGTITTSGTIAVDVGTTANKIVQLDGSARLPAVDASQVTGLTSSQIPSLDAAKITTGVFTASQIPNLDWSKITTGKPTTISGYGITNAVTNAGSVISMQSGLDASKGSATTAGRLYVATDTSKVYFDDGTQWVQVASNTGTTYTAGTGLSLSSGTFSISTVPVANGGTGATTPSDARTNLGLGTASTLNAGTSANNLVQLDGSAKIPLALLPTLTASEIPSLDAAKITTGVLPIARGGTNSGTTLNNNRVMISSSGAIVESTAITASRAIASDSNGLPVASTTSATELGYLTGVTSAVQTQLNAKASSSGWTNYSVIASNGSGDLTAIPGSSAGQMLNWTVTGPAWTTATFPTSTTANQLLYSSANNVVGGLTTANNAILTTNGSGVPSWTALSGDAFTQYALLAGRSGGQTINGGTAASNNLTLDSTSNATKGNILLNPTGGNVGVGTTNPIARLHVVGASATNSDISTYQARFTDGTRSLGFGVTATTAEIQSTGAVPLLLNPSGNNVGIGTSSPSNSLSVVSSTGYPLFVGSSNTDSAGLLMNNSSASRTWGVGVGGSTTGVGSGKFFIADTTAGSFRLAIDTNGNIGVGTSSPTGALHLKAGTASANTAPLKFTAGTNLTTPEAGAIEFDGTNLYYTDSTNTRRTLASTSGTSSFSSVSTISNTGNITLAPTASSGSVLVNSGTASAGTTSGALVVTGGIGVSGVINAGGNIATSGAISSGSTISATTSLVSPIHYGSTANSGTLTLESTSAATKGNLLLNPNGGNVGIGTSSPNSLLEVSGTVGISTNGAPAVSLSSIVPRFQVNELGGVAQSIVRSTNDSAGANLVFQKTRGANGTTLTATQNGDSLGQISWMGSDGTGWAVPARIQAIVNGTVATGSVPADLVFKTGTDGSGAERVRITSTGFLGIGTTNPLSALDVAGNGRFSTSTAKVTLGSAVAASEKGISLYYSGSDYGVLQAEHQGTSYKNIAINPFGGNVGVGTASPSVMFDVAGSGRIQSNFTVGGNANSGMISANAGMNWNFPGLALKRTSSNTTVSRMIGFMLDGDTSTDTTDNNYFKISLDHGSIPTATTASSSSTHLRFNGPGNIIFNQAGNVGIGTASPTAKLEVSGTVKATGFDGPISGSSSLNLSPTNTTATAGYSISNQVSTTYTPGATVASGTYIYGNKSGLSTSGASDMSNAILYSSISQANHTTNSNVNSLNGFFSSAQNSGSGTIAVSNGVEAYSTNAGAGTITNSIGANMNAINSSTGTITNASGVIGAVANTSTGTITTARGGAFSVSNSGGGTVTTGYGVYIGNVQAATKWSLFSADASAPSYFNGSIALGTTSPVGKLRSYRTDADPSSTTYNTYLDSYPTYTADNANDSWGNLSSISPSVAATRTVTGMLSGMYGIGVPVSSNAGTLSRLAGIRLDYGIQSGGGGTISNAYGVYVQPYHQAGTISNSYGLFIANPSSGGTVTNEYGVYQTSATAKNYFAGSMGFGTTSPGAYVDAVKNQNTDTSIRALNSDTGSSAGSSLRAQSDAGQFFMVQGSAANNSGYSVLESNTSGNMHIRKTNNSGDIIFNTTTSYTERMRIKNDGKVGIGTASPVSQFHVLQASTRQIASGGSGGAWVDLSSAGGGQAMIASNAYLNATDSTFRYSSTHSHSGGIGATGIVMNSPSWGDTSFFGAVGATTADASFTPTNNMVIKSTGNVGIGTSSPGAPLHVSKTAAGAEVIGLALANPDGTANAAVTLDLNPVNASAGARSVQIAGITNGANQTSMVFRTSNAASPAEAMRITNGLNVGIGTTSPSSKLEVAGNTTTLLTVTAAGGSVYPETKFRSFRGTLTAPTATGSNDILGRLTFGGYGATAETNNRTTIVARAVENFTDTANGTQLEFWTTPTGSTSPSNRMTIDYLGRVGIGMSSPSSTLDVFATNAKIRVRDSGQSNGLEFYQQNSDGGNFIMAANNNYLAIGTNATERVRVLAGGNVGIGITNPTATLDVFGAIKTRDVSNAGTTIDFSTGNLQYTSSSCGAFTLNNLKPGGTYTLAIQGTGGGTCSFSAFTGVGSGSLTVKSGSVGLTQTANKHVLFTFMVMGSFVYVASIDNY